MQAACHAITDGDHTRERIQKVHVSTLELQPVVDAESARLWHRVDEATRPSDHPADPIGEVLPRVHAPSATGECTELWVGLLDGQPVVSGDLTLPTLDNEANATIDVRVLEDQRRHGWGSAMLAHLVDRARNASRRRVFGEVEEPLDGSEDAAGVGFVRAVGARPVLTDIRRVLDVSQVDDEQLASLSDDAWKHADGYSLVQWIDRAPEEIVDDLAELTGRMSVDVPLEDMEWGAERYDAARVRAREESVIAMGRRRVVTAARHEATGRLVAYTDIGVNAKRPRVAYQWDTLVRSDHRGHRLGLLIKASNLRLLRETTPGAELVNTWNAEVNTHMIAINEALGFRAVQRERQWELLI
jgi:GNAT superfamily N-acetyltransferase